MAADPDRGTSGPTAPPHLNFLSDQFDAHTALHEDDLQPPVAHIPPLDNVSACRRLLPATHPDAVIQQQKTANEASRKKHLAFKESAARVIEKIHASTTVSLQAVHASVRPGPLQLLAKWCATDARVVVVTRHARGMRGRACGQLVAYDRFSNVVLRDVTEQYTVLLRVPTTKERVMAAHAAGGDGDGGGDDDEAIEASQGVGGDNLAGGGGACDSRRRLGLDPDRAMHDGDDGDADGGGCMDGADAVEPGEMGERSRVVRVTRWRRKQDTRRRQLGQVFIKGDNIITVNAEGAGQGPDAAATAAELRVGC